MLALRPGLLLLDEVTANLDPDGVALVTTVLARVLAESGATAVIVEHRVEQVVDLVTRAVVLAPGGGVVADGPPAEVFGVQGAALAEARRVGAGPAPRRTAPRRHRSRTRAAHRGGRAVPVPGGRPGRAAGDRPRRCGPAPRWR